MAGRAPENGIRPGHADGSLWTTRWLCISRSAQLWGEDVPDTRHGGRPRTLEAALAAGTDGRALHARAFHNGKIDLHGRPGWTWCRSTDSAPVAYGRFQAPAGVAARALLMRWPARCDDRYPDDLDAPGRNRYGASRSRGSTAPRLPRLGASTAKAQAARSSAAPPGKVVAAQRAAGDRAIVTDTPGTTRTRWRRDDVHGRAVVDTAGTAHPPPA